MTMSQYPERTRVRNCPGLNPSEKLNIAQIYGDLNL